MNRLRIRPKLAVAALTTLAVLTVAVSTGLLLWNLHTSELAHARGETVSLSHILAEQTTRTIQNVDLVMQNTQVLLAELDTAGVPPSGRFVHDLLRNRLEDMPQMKGLFVTDASGKVVNSARTFPVSGPAVADRQYFLAHKDNPRLGLFIDSPTHSRIDGMPTLYLSRRLYGAEGQFRGVLAVALNLTYFETLYESIAFDGIGPISLYLADGTPIVRQPHDGFDGNPKPEKSAPFRNGADESTQTETSATGEARIVTYRHVSQFPLMVGVAIGKKNVLANWWDSARYILVGALWVTALLVIAGWALARGLKKEEVLAQELLESSERLQGTIDSAMDAVIILDASQRVILFNPAAEKMFGCDVGKAIGSPLERFMPLRFRAGHRLHIDQFGASGVRSRIMAPQREIIGLRADGKEFPIELTISQVKLHGEIIYTAILRDITDRKMAQEQLIESNTQLRQLSGSLQRVREEERSRIARELHDELGQQLTGLKMDLSWLINQFPDDHDGLEDKIVGMKQQLDATIKSVRRISTELRPTLLDDLGLGAAMEWLADDFAKKTGVAVSLDLAGEKFARGDPLVTALFRIMQECLTNIAKHAEAKRVGISLLRVGNTIELCVADDGKGMDNPGKSKDGSHGLVGIRERAIMLGAQATFTSHPGAGMKVRIVIPLEAHAKVAA